MGNNNGYNKIKESYVSTPEVPPLLPPNKPSPGSYAGDKPSLPPNKPRFKNHESSYGKKHKKRKSKRSRRSKKSK